MRISQSALVIVITFCATASPAQNMGSVSPLWSVVHAESTFARTSAEKGMGSAFLAFLSDEAIIFRPHPVNGQEWFRSHPAPPILLAWTPGFADVSVTGELGYTTGPWIARDKADPAGTPAYGDFVTVWKKRGSAWKVDLDLGVSHPAPAGSVHLVSPPNTDRPTVLVRPDSGLQTAEWSKIHAVERKAFGDSLHYVPASNLLALLSSDARVYRPGHFPLVGSDSVKGYFDSQPGTFFRRSLGGDLARGADLAYTYGSYHFRGKDASEEKGGYYVTIWKKEGKGAWKVVLDLESKLPTQKK